MDYRLLIMENQFLVEHYNMSTYSIIFMHIICMHTIIVHFSDVEFYRIFHSHLVCVVGINYVQLEKIALLT